MRKVIIISFDAVGDLEFNHLRTYPNFKKLAEKSAVIRNVSSIYLSNTYPIHASIATGVTPAIHGIISNTETFPKRHKRWYSHAGRFKTRTIWQAAELNKIETAAVMWPVTAGAKEIKYNIPEVMALPGENQITVSLKAGSKKLQLIEFLRHRKKIQGIKQPYLDDFSTSCMVDIIQKYKPGLMLMHLTAYDSLCHQYGKDAPEMETAYQSLDSNLGRLLAAIDDDTTVIGFSDHSQININKSLAPNDLLVEHGFLKQQEGNYQKGSPGCYIECCGGSAFLRPGTLSEEQIASIKIQIEKSEGFGRFLTSAEMKTCGRRKLPFGFAAARGYSYDAVPTNEKANHGYPLDYDNYKVFYMASGPDIRPGIELLGGNILEVTPLAAKLLGIKFPTLKDARKEIFFNKER